VGLHFAHFEGICGQSHSLHFVEGHHWVALGVSEAHQIAVTEDPWGTVGPWGEGVQGSHREDQEGAEGLPFQGDP